MIGSNRVWRYSFLGGVLFFLPVLIVLQMIRIQLNPEQVQKFLIESKAYTNERRNVIPARGQIYDRWGNLFAGNRKIYEIGVNLQNVRNPNTIAQGLKLRLGLLS